MILIAKVRSFECPVCGAMLGGHTMTTAHPESPEVVCFGPLQSPQSSGPWLGIVGSQPSALLVLCSRTCAEIFFTDGG